MIPALTGEQLSGRGAELVTRCPNPSHVDEHPSCRVNVGKQLWCCDPCGIGGDVFEWVKRYRQCDFRDALTWLAARAGQNGTRQPVGPSGEWIYRDLDGRPVFKVQRFDPSSRKKTFRQLRADGQAGWISGTGAMARVPRVLYRVDELKGKKTAWVPEGERCVDALLEIGCPATTNSAGACRWESTTFPIAFGSYAEQLRQAGVENVVVLPDCDEPGRRHADTVARSCHAAVVTVPDMPPKGDVIDFLARGGTRDGLEQCVASTPDWRPAPVSMSDLPDEARLLARLNKGHAVVREAGKTVVINEEFDPVLQRRKITHSSFADFTNFYGAQKVDAGCTKDGEPKVQGLGRWWLDHPDRRQYDGVVCDPGGNTPGYYNLWQGFAVEPRAGDWSLSKEHLYEHICTGNATLYDYVLAILAAGVQRPGDPAEVALVLRRARGTAKGIVARSYGGLFGQHFVHVAQARHLTGHFNAHLRDAVVVFADEPFFPGDKQSEGALKMLITEPVIPIEAKGRDVVVVKNMIHLILASNHDWVVPAGLDERRFCVLDVSAARQQDHDYFRAIAEELDHGGREAMLDDLLRHDCSQVNLRQVPATTALVEQKLRSMTPNERWWFQKLSDGHLLPTHETWTQEVVKVALYQDYVDTLGKIGVKQKSVATELGMFLARMIPPATLETCRKVVRVPRGVGRSDEGQPQSLAHWRFPPLAECRAAFDRLSGAGHQWD